MNKRRFEGSASSLKPADHQWHARGQGFKSPQLHAEPAPLVRVHLISALRNSEGPRYSTEVPQTGNRFTISGIE